jgi:hypothetical protein
LHSALLGGGRAFAGANQTFGYAFTLSSPVLVTQLGLWDEGNNGLISSHAVTIWTSTGTQLVQATIPAGTGGTLTNGFRYVSIAPFSLAAGTYTIAGFYSPDSTSMYGPNSPLRSQLLPGLLTLVLGPQILDSSFRRVTPSTSRTVTSARTSNLPRLRRFRHRNNSFPAQFGFARLGYLAAQIGLLSPERLCQTAGQP